jgi:hypothetical protein
MAKLARERRIIEKREAKREKKQAAAEAKAAGETELSPEELAALNAPNEQGPDRPARDLSL